MLVMVDGSMLLTRPKDWKEIKLGRIFNQSKIVRINTKRNEITESIYVSHMGSIDEFFPKLVIFANQQFRDDDKRKSWIKDKTEKLLQNLVEQVISELKSLRSKNELSKEAKQKTIKYFTDHCERMMYKTFIDKGLLIGSGPIEAAHRNVLQQRMKLSGQKWTIKGANAMANLRCYRKSGAWHIIKSFIKAA
jgi:hypothetical protein